VVKFPEVDVPKPNMPSSEDGVGWLEKASGWVTNMDANTMKLLVIGLLAALIYWLVRRSAILKGVLIGAVLLAIVMVIV
jgi:hypothetical protein